MLADRSHARPYSKAEDRAEAQHEIGQYQLTSEWLGPESAHRQAAGIVSA